MVDANAAVRPAPPLLPALGAMTSLQALVALALFAPGVVAPRAQIEVWQLSMFSCAVFAVGIPASFWGGGFIARLGSLRIASLCAAAIVVSMALASLGSTVALLAAGLCLGLAFGPETPASAALLSRLVTAERRAFVFSVRQTGNQIGAVCGSLVLPAIAVSLGPTWCYAAVGACALLGILLFERLRPTYAGKVLPPSELGLRARLALVTADRRIAVLALASMPFSAMQVSLNTLFVTLGTRELGLSHIEAGIALACAQAGGLVGRLGWGYVAMQLDASRMVLVVIGLGMAFCAALLGLDGASLGRTGQLAIAALFGLTASGWNGVFVAEIARLAPQDRIGETTGAVLTASYAGLLAAPALLSILDRVASLGAAFSALACLALCGTSALIWGGHDKAG
ncbi:MFS transporter [Bradyrhizobium daqingense]|uniref:Putative MFS family arabinose efflux permease n=1 Tax=Bradyrhizobium daqingense TaxID=993502 RepID=A0A562KTH3_9BRAD|nr:MFS transporter [Bradyrhizobium daqingense]TWH98682.1 putative MFS family arabinose efflux permease [Bradyrhizobium daqingense]UFS86121.1 MFS transporter [Bradyrhizobium daqingense]